MGAWMRFSGGRDGFRIAPRLDPPQKQRDEPDDDDDDEDEEEYRNDGLHVEHLLGREQEREQDGDGEEANGGVGHAATASSRP